MASLPRQASAKELSILASLWPHLLPHDIFFKEHALLPVVLTFFDELSTVFERDHSLLFPLYQRDQLIGMLRKNSCLEVDISLLVQNLHFEDLYNSLVTKPVQVLGCLNCALSLLAAKLNPYVEFPSIIQCRLLNMQDLSSYADLKSSKVGQLVCLHGYVVKVSAIRPLVTQAAFFCSKCQQQFMNAFEDGVFNPPNICPTSRCGNKYLELQRQSITTIPFQRVKLQELDDYEESESVVRVPRTFEVEVRGDLVNLCQVGDMVKVIGIIKTMQIDIQRQTKEFVKDGGLYQLYLVANSLCRVSNKSMSEKPSENTNSHITMSHDSYSIPELTSIRSTALHPNCVALLVNSLCPAIYGNELVKLGLLLSLFGGTNMNSKSSMNIRNDIHILMVGEPGLGKSQLLRASVSAASRGVMVCGNTATSVGLTCAIGRDGRDSSIEAGALVLADSGICGIDELDKMSCDYHALLEAMEQQRISVAKGGVVTSLKTRTSIIAAANPVSGHYNRGKSICENLKMPAALLSRFDIVFILLDKPEDDHDLRISEHIMNTHRLSQVDRMFHGNTSQDFSNMTLSQKLKHTCRQVIQEISHQELRTYIEYARKYVHPKLTRGAAKILQKLYLTLRAQAKLGQTIPVTTRHLESLIRLSQARAKLELREEVTESDANDVVQLLQESLLDAFTNETGQVDFSRKGGISTTKLVKLLVRSLSREAEIKGSSIFTKNEIVEIATRMQLLRDSKNNDLETVIDVMRTECYLLLKGPKLFQLSTANNF